MEIILRQCKKTRLVIAQKMLSVNIFVILFFKVKLPCYTLKDNGNVKYIPYIFKVTQTIYLVYSLEYITLAQ